MEDKWENKENRDRNDPEERRKMEELRRAEMERLNLAREEREIDEVVRPVIGTVKRFLENEEIPKMAAKFVRRYYVALMDEGFTQENAIRIMVASIGNLKK